MAANYLEMLTKLQSQTLEGIKQVESAQLAVLTTAREMVTSLPSALSTTPSVPTIESLPTFAQFAELNASFANQVFDQQKAFVSQLAEIFTPSVKHSSN